MTWYEDYFTAEWMRFRDVDAMLEKTPAEVDFLEEALQITPPAPVLDVGCGFGRHAVELASRGYTVTGIDLSPELIAESEKLSQKRSFFVSWKEMDMRKMEFEEEFDGIVCLFTSFGYYDSDEEDLDVLRRMSRALRREGRLVLDIENRDGLLMRYQDRDWWQTKRGDYVMEHRRFDPVKGKGHTRIALVSEGKAQEHNLLVRWYSVPELERMFNEAGLETVTLYGGLDGSEYNLEAMRLVAVARKQ
jgi:SAM-dependent methyltransferase